MRIIVRSLLLLFASVLSTFVWLIVPFLLQTIVDKALPQGSIATINALGLMTIACSVLHVFLEWLQQLLLVGGMSAGERRSYVRLYALSEMLKILLAAIAMVLYSYLLAATWLAAIAILSAGIAVFARLFGMERAGKVRQVRQLVFHSNQNFNLSVLAVIGSFWVAIYLVSQEALTLGQCLAFCTIALKASAVHFNLVKSFWGRSQLELASD